MPSKSNTESDGTEHVLECVHERTSAEPDGKQNNTSNIWTGRTRMKGDGSSNRSPLERDAVPAVIDQLVAEKKVLEWHGLLAPATESHLKAIIENERQSGEPRKLLIGKANRLLQHKKCEIRADGGVEEGDTHRCVAPDGDGGFCENEAIGRFEVDEGDRMLRADFCVEHEPGYEPVEYLNTDSGVDA